MVVEIAKEWAIIGPDERIIQKEEERDDLREPREREEVVALPKNVPSGPI